MDEKTGLILLIILACAALLFLLILPAMGVYDWDTAGEISDVLQQVMQSF